MNQTNYEPRPYQAPANPCPVWLDAVPDNEEFFYFGPARDDSFRTLHHVAGLVQIRLKYDRFQRATDTLHGAAALAAAFAAASTDRMGDFNTLDLAASMVGEISLLELELGGEA